jgi:hypothetical protein
MNAISSFISLIDAYRAARGVSDARVSTLVFNDGGRIAQIRSGGDIGTRRLQRAIEWFSENWPHDAMWPADLPLPVPSPSRSPAQSEAAA